MPATPIMDFTTERLTIRHWAPDLVDPDRRATLAAELHAILTPPVLDHLPPPLQLASTEQTIDRWIEDRHGESKVFRVCLREPDALIGLLILAETDDPAPTFHIGYLLAESAWGRGYGSELLAGLTFACAAGTHLIGGVAAGNPASARVLEKCGFDRSADLSTLDTDMFVWTARRNG